MFKKLSYLLPVIALGACAYTIDNTYQDVMFKTPGAEHAKCFVYIEKLKYIARPPLVVNVFKSEQPMKVDCVAPGGRRKMIEVAPSLEPSAALNVGNGGVGLVWDYASRALFRWPDVIEIDFTGIPITDAPLPAQNSPDIRQPEDYPLEEYLPGAPRLNSDKNALPVEIQRRQTGNVQSRTGSSNAGAFYEPSRTAGGKGSFGTPVPLIPGE